MLNSMRDGTDGGGSTHGWSRNFIRGGEKRSFRVSNDLTLSSIEAYVSSARNVPREKEIGPTSPSFMRKTWWSLRFDPNDKCVRKCCGDVYSDVNQPLIILARVSEILRCQDFVILLKIFYHLFIYIPFLRHRVSYISFIYPFVFLHVNLHNIVAYEQLNSILTIDITVSM